MNKLLVTTDFCQPMLKSYNSINSILVKLIIHGQTFSVSGPTDWKVQSLLDGG